MSAYRCARCQWWDSRNDARGLCRREAPLPDPRSERGDAYWPTTVDTDWCAQFSPRREAPLTAVPA